MTEGSRDQLVRDPRVLKLYQEIVDGGQRHDFKAPAQMKLDA